MKTPKKLGILILAACLLPAMLFGCGNGPNSPGTSKTTVSPAAVTSTTAATTASAAASTGSLTVSSDTSADETDLTSVGVTDWAHWYGYDQKSGGGSKISNYTVLGSGTATNYEDDPRLITWSDGSPTASGSSNCGIYVEGRGSGFSIDVPAKTTAQTVTVYVGGWKSSGMLTAHLSDGSAPDFTETTDQAEDSFDKAYTLVFQAASEGQTLNIKWLQASSGEGNVTLQAAALE